MRHFRECPRCEASGCLMIWFLGLGTFLAVAVNEQNWARLTVMGAVLVYLFARCYTSLGECLKQRGDP